MTNRDTYFFDLCRDAGLSPNDPADWVNMSILGAMLPDLDEEQEILSS